MTGERLLLTRLFERTSAKGNVYLVGRLGLAKLVLFQGKPTDDGQPTWDAYLCPAPEPQNGGGACPERPAVPRERAAAPAMNGHCQPDRRPTASRARPAAPAGDDDGELNDDLPF